MSKDFRGAKRLPWRSKDFRGDVTLLSPAKTAEPIEMPFGLKTWVGQGNHVLDGGPDPPWEGAIMRGKGASHCKYRDTLRSFVQKRQNRSRCPFGCGLGYAQGIMC